LKVSVIIPNYNYADFLEQSIQSVFFQTYKNIECIVVNDGSTDNSIEILNQLKEKKFPKLIVIDKVNGGLSSARNSGIQKSTGELIAFLDADDIWAPGKLENQINIFDQNCPDIVFSNYQFFNGEEYFDHNENIFFSPTLIDFIRKNPILGSSSSIILKREVIDKIGEFDLSLRSLEDLDYWFRCSLGGFNFFLSNTKDVFLRTHTYGNMSKNYMRMLSYHLILLDRQINTIKKFDLFRFDKKAINSAISNRLGIIRWYALKVNKHEYSLLTIFMGVNLIGIKYLFSWLIFKRAIKDLYNIIK